MSLMRLPTQMSSRSPASMRSGFLIPFSRCKLAIVTVVLPAASAMTNSESPGRIRTTHLGLCALRTGTSVVVVVVVVVRRGGVVVVVRGGRVGGVVVTVEGAVVGSVRGVSSVVGGTDVESLEVSRWAEHAPSTSTPTRSATVTCRRSRIGSRVQPRPEPLPAPPLTCRGSRPVDRHARPATSRHRVGPEPRRRRPRRRPRGPQAVTTASQEGAKTDLTRCYLRMWK